MTHIEAKSETEVGGRGEDYRTAGNQMIKKMIEMNRQILDGFVYRVLWKAWRGKHDSKSG